MESGLSFMPDNPQMVQFFIHGGPIQQESMIFWQFACVVVCEFLCWYISSVYALFAKFDSPV